MARKKRRTPATKAKTLPKPKAKTRIWQPKEAGRLDWKCWFGDGAGDKPGGQQKLALRRQLL